MVRKLYPQGRKKAFNITYDDGVWQDIPFVALLNKYGLKGTFNLNSELMLNGFVWTHDCGMPIKRMPPEIAAKLYEGHEIAGHSLTHPYMQGLSEAEIMYQLGHDKWQLGQFFGRDICGFAVPFDYYSELIAQCAKNCGFEYSRCSEESHSYAPPRDYYRWRAGIFHLSPELNDFVDGFLNTDEELALCQIVGHSYDLDAENMWPLMDGILSRIAGDVDTISMTNLELVRYLKAMDRAEISHDRIVNHSDMELWFEANGRTIALSPGEESILSLEI